MRDRLREQLGLAAAGAAQGLALWLLVDHWPDDHVARAAAVAALTFVAATTAVLHFAWTGTDRGRLAALSIGVGVAYAAVAGWVGASMPLDPSVMPGAEDRGLVWGLAAAVTLYVLGPFVQILQRTGAPRFPYRDLFLHGWNNFFVALVGALFLGALWTVLLLWAALFDLIGIGLFQELFERGAFAWPVSGAALGFGVALGRDSERVVSTLRGVTLSVFRALLPLVGGVALLFLASLGFTGLASLWSTNHASTLLLAWVALTVLFLNAVYQDGSGAAPLPAPLRRLVEAALVAMTVFAGLSIYALALRIDQYGLTPTRMWGVLFAIVLGAYAGGYAFAVFRRGAPWLRAVRAVNLFVALVVVAIGLAAHTPLLDPIGWSARSQVARLLDGRTDPSDFDYGYLRFQLGRPGVEAFDELDTLTDHPELARIRDGVARARSADDYWDWTRRRSATIPRTRIEPLPPELAVPAKLLSAAGTTFAESCRVARLCAVFRADVAGGPPQEWVLVAVQDRWHQLLVLAEDESGRLAVLGELQTGDGPQDPEALERALRALAFRTVAPLDRDLEIGDVRYRLPSR